MPEAKGTIVWMGDIQEVTEIFKKREFAICVSRFDPNTGEEFPHDEAFQVINNRVNALDNIGLGDKVEVRYQVRSKRHEKEGLVRYFTNLDAFRIDVLEKAKIETGGTVHQDNPADDLPF